MQFDADEVERIMRIRMARWLGITPRQWDRMSYQDQCDAMQIAKAEKQIADYDAHKARARQHRPRAGRRR